MKPFNELMTAVANATTPNDLDSVRLYLRGNAANFPLSQLEYAQEAIVKKSQDFIVPLTKEQKGILTSFSSWLNQ